MKFMKRLLLICLLLVVVLAVAFFLALRFLPETDLMRRSVQDKLRELTGREISVGSLRVTSSLADPIRLEVNGISLISASGLPRASADRIVLSPSFAGLLHKELSIRSITVSGLLITMEQGPDGAVHHPFAATVTETPSVAPAREVQGPAVARPTGEADSALGPAPVSVPAESTLKWSVKNIELLDGRIEWIDRQIVPGKDTVFALTSLTGSLEHQSAGETVVVNISSQLNVAGVNIGPVKLGLAAPFVQGSFPKKGNLVAASDIVLTEPLRACLPTWLQLDPTLKHCSARADLDWDQEQVPRISITAELKDNSGQSAKLDFQGEIEPEDNFSGIQGIRGMLDTKALPLRFVGPSLPSELPISPESGIVKSSVNFEWMRDHDWQLQGRVGLEDADLSGPWKQIADRVGIDSELQLSPQALSVKRLEIWGSARLASVTGKIEQPFSSARVIDLSGEATAPNHLVKDFAGKYSKALTFKGSIPLRGRVRGSVDDLLFELSGDASSAGVQWSPHLEKNAGNKATFGLKGKMLRGGHGKVPGTMVSGRVQLDINGARIRLAERAPWIEKSSLNFESKVLLRGPAMDLKDASLVVKGGANAREIVAVSAGVGDIASSTPRIEGHASAGVDRELLTFAGLEIPADLSLTGRAKTKATFVGSTRELNWTIDAPLANVDIAVASTFRKPAAVAGSLKAAGKWARQELLLTDGTLTLPGVTVKFGGHLLGRDGRFQGLTVNLNRADAKDVARFFPAVGGAKFSGPVEGTFHLKASEKGLGTSGMVRLVAMDYRPEKAPWSLEKLQGTIQNEGESLVSEGIIGKVRGTIEAPLKVKANLNNISSLEGMTGRVALNLGQGRIKAESVRSTLNQARLLIGTLLNPQGPAPKSDLLEFESLSGEFDVKSGAAVTENVQLKGSEFSSAAIGSLRLDTMSLDALAGIHTVTVAGDALGKIPQVQKFVKQHEELLKMTGLDKELKRIGIQIPKDSEPKPDGHEPVKTPVTVIVRVRGSASSPEVVPVLEGSLNKNTLARLKSLMN